MSAAPAPSLWSSFAWAAPDAARLKGFACPNCGDDGPKRPLLSVAWWSRSAPGTARPSDQMFCCETCGARFLLDLNRTSSGAEEYYPPYRLPFYVQQTAGLETMTRLIARLLVRPEARYLDVGCNYGFTLDFARAAKGWQAEGVDPSASAVAGAAALSVPIAPRLLAPEDAAKVRSGQSPGYDVVSAVEVIEHIGDPRGFVALLRGMLAPGGVLALSTPAGGQLRPEAHDQQVFSLLASGNHVVLQTRQSLEHVLRAAGFSHVTILPEGMGLCAYASDAPLMLEQNAALLRREYRNWLESALDRTDLASDPYLGLAGRAMVEAANDGDEVMAARAWGKIRPAIQARYGFDPAGPLPHLPPHAGELVKQAPFCLGVLIYADALTQVLMGGDRARLASRFREAARLCRDIQAALAAGGFPGADGQSKDLGWVASAEALVCDVAANDRMVLERLRDLPMPEAGAARRAALVERLITDAGNRGFAELAERLTSRPTLPTNESFGRLK